MTLQELASVALHCFELKETKKNNRMYTLKRGTPDWVIDLVYEAVPEIVSDNFIFKNVYSLLELVIQNKSKEEIYLAPDGGLENQVKWLLGHKSRRLFVADILGENCRIDIESVLCAAQKLELEVIQNSVFSILQLELERLKQREGEKNELKKR